MSQPNPADYREPDPLLAFFEEAAAPRPVESAEAVQRVEPPANALDPPAVQATAADPELRRRLERAERQIERTLIDITALKSDLATLVSAVEDIKKRMSRPPARPAPVAAVPPPKRASRRAIAAIILLLMAGAALWGFVSVATSDLPEPPALESETSASVEPPGSIEREGYRRWTRVVAVAANRISRVPRGTLRNEVS